MEIKQEDALQCLVTGDILSIYKIHFLFSSDFDLNGFQINLPTFSRLCDFLPLTYG